MQPLVSLLVSHFELVVKLTNKKVGCRCVSWQPVQIDSLGGCILWFLLGNQFKLTHKVAACCSLNWLTRRLHVVVFAWQPVQIDSLYRMLHVVVFTWQPVQIDSQGGYIYGFCLATSSDWLTTIVKRRLCFVVFGWQPVQLTLPRLAHEWLMNEVVPVDVVSSWYNERWSDATDKGTTISALLLQCHGECLSMSSLRSYNFR